MQPSAMPARLGNPVVASWIVFDQFKPDLIASSLAPNASAQPQDAATRLMLITSNSSWAE